MPGGSGVVYGADVGERCRPEMLATSPANLLNKAQGGEGADRPEGV